VPKVSRAWIALPLATAALMLACGCSATPGAAPPPHQPTSALVVSKQALSAAIAKSLPEVISSSRYMAASSFPGGRRPSDAWFARVHVLGGPQPVMGVRGVSGDSLSSLVSTQPAYYLEQMSLDSSPVGEFELQPLGGNRLRLFYWDWNLRDLNDLDRAASLASSAFDGSWNERYVWDGKSQAVIDWAGPRQSVVFTYTTVPGIERFKAYENAEAVRVARLAFGTR
jgi:hypothetical protein